ncbi:hypothetical protein QZQ97_19440 [Serratia sp. root2]|nr:hypothetical protein [Serratia sp. root2]MDT3253098.1 hypothetical protein [Serratia sp. root2]
MNLIVAITKIIDIKNLDKDSGAAEARGKPIPVTRRSDVEIMKPTITEI